MAGLNSTEKHALRALAHDLEPVVQVGVKGVTASVVKQVDAALETHELIKVKLGRHLPENAPQPADALAVATHSEVIQQIGKVIVLFRKRKEKEEKEKKPAPRKRASTPRKKAAVRRPPRPRASPRRSRSRA